MTLIENILALLPNVPFLPPGPPIEAHKDEVKQKSPLNRFLGAPSEERKGNNRSMSENQQQSR